jgi:hypothetical protein
VVLGDGSPSNFAMSQNARRWRFSALFTLALLVSGCNRPRRLQSVIIGPVSADAQDFPGGKVKFVATGVFNEPPLSVTPLPVRWTNGLSWNGPPSSDITIDAGGVAHCNPGFTGAASVMAFAPADPRLTLSQVNSRTRLVSGTAQLMCP